MTFRNVVDIAIVVLLFALAIHWLILGATGLASLAFFAASDRVRIAQLEEESIRRNC